MNNRRRAPHRTALALLILALPAAAETYPVGPLRVEIPALTDPTACIDRAGGGDRAMAACSGPEVAAWDRRLNAAFAALRRALPQPEFARLQAAQRAWIAYRDHECAADPEGGTAAHLDAAACLVRLTATRAAELERRVRTAAEHH